MGTVRTWGEAVVLAVALAIGGCAMTEIEPATVSSAERGRQWFELYCGECHGPSARGDGPLASSFEPPAPDLTKIATRHGFFIADGVAAYIDGRTYVEEHGPRDMPVWGRKLDDRTSALDDELRLSPPVIAEIVDYLASVQAR